MSSPRNTIGHGLTKNAKWLDAFANVFGAIVGGFYRIPGTGPIKSMLHGTWPLQHPLHPAITDATIGGYTAMVALDIFYLLGRDASLTHASDVLLIFSFATSLVSIVSGLTDWNDTYAEERRNGMLHGLLMVVATVFFLVSLWMRLNSGAAARDTALYISLVGWAVMTVAAFLGGEEAFGYGTQVNRQAWSDTKTKWQKLDVAAKGLDDRKPIVGKTKEGVEVMVVQVDGKLYGITKVCTHAGGPLNEGKWVGGDRCQIECPWHGSRFDIRDGAAVRGPATFDAIRFDVREGDGGFIEVRAHD
jgi:nitrite reductase/ring-hydroxylating ferredoxin subunit/uncharacterized membrane protein